jgi:hypothetical protein
MTLSACRSYLAKSLEHHHVFAWPWMQLADFTRVAARPHGFTLGAVDQVVTVPLSV